MTDDPNTEKSEDSSDGPSRRTFLVGAAATGALFGGMGLGYGRQEATNIRLDGEASGWVGVEPASIEGETNPTLELQAGTTYSLTWENADGLPHNVNIETENDEHPVSTEIMDQEGETQTVEFTATTEMAEYYCEVHPESMRGDVEVSEATETPTETPTPEEEEEGPSASVTFEDQTTDGSSVEVGSVTMSEGGFVAIHDSRLLDGDAIESVVGVSEFLEAGTHEDVMVELDEAPEDGETLVAMPHLDTNDSQTYDYVSSEGSEDGPYTDADGAVTDDATVTVEDEGPDVEPREFEAELAGENEVPPVETNASGEAHLQTEQHDDQLDLHYEVMVQNMRCTVAAHIHLGGPDENGPIVVGLFDSDEPVEVSDGTLAEGTATADDLVGPLEGEDLSALVEEMDAGNTYVNVHSTKHPAGEIRGQIESANDE